jgi:hypothetical protein
MLANVLLKLDNINQQNVSKARPTGQTTFCCPPLRWSLKSLFISIKIRASRVCKHFLAVSRKEFKLSVGWLTCYALVFGLTFLLPLFSEWGMAVVGYNGTRREGLFCAA